MRRVRDYAQVRADGRVTLEVAQAANQYLDARAPWSAVKTDRDHAAETLYVALNVISGIVTMLHPGVAVAPQRRLFQQEEQHQPGDRHARPVVGLPEAGIEGVVAEPEHLRCCAR